MKKRHFSIIIVCVYLVIISSCKKEKKDDLNNPDCSTINSGYASSIKPIINANCLSSGCHNAGSPNGDYTTYTGLKANADNGSLDNRVIQQKNMPPTGALSMDDLKKIKCWLNSGAQNN